MKIENGGAIANLGYGEDKTIKSIVFGITTSSDPYTFEMWINGDCLSYLSLTEMLEIRDDINSVITKALNCKGGRT